MAQSSSNPSTLQELHSLKCKPSSLRGGTCMSRQKALVNDFVDRYEISSPWDKIKKGLLYNNVETKLRRLVKLVPCSIESNHSIYLLPFRVPENC